jgi:DNA-3-methyladenine glycosylase II
MIRMDPPFLRSATDALARRDPAMKRILVGWGYPPLCERPTGFSTMVHIILEQQVSLQSANATWARLNLLLDDDVTPIALMNASDEDLRTIGFSMQKIRYSKSMADAVQSGRFHFDALEDLDDDTATGQLKTLLGVGDWSAAIYLSECLLRPDILPKGDIAVLEMTRRIHGLNDRPSHDELVALSEVWRPYRSVATRLLWHAYLNGG